MVTKTQGTAAVATVATVGTCTGLALTNTKEDNLSVDDSNQENSDSQSTSNESAETSYSDSSGSIGLQNGITVLSLETNFSSNYSNAGTQQTLGGLYGGYFMGTYGKNDSNKSWWDKSYKVWENNKSYGNLSNEFKESEVSSAFASNSSSDSKTLNKVCDKVYKKKKSEIKFENYKYGSEDNNDKKLIRDIMKYCSPMGRVPETVGETGESGYGASSIGLTKKDFLASVNATSNDVFWKLRDDDFFRNNDNYWSGSLLKSNSNAPTDLKNLYNQGSSASESLGIKKICSEKYSLSNSIAKADTYVYYCSWSLSS